MRFNSEKKKYISPISFFLILIVIVIVLSVILSLLGVQADYLKINTVTKEVESTTLAVESLFSVSSLRYIVSNTINNFVGFSPLAMLIVALIGLGIAEKSGYLRTLLTIITKKIDRKVLTFIIMLLGILSSVSDDLGFVLLIPISAYVFMYNKRSPLAGVVAAYAGITGGFGINLFVSAIDSILINYTTMAANMLDKNYTIALSCTVIIMIVSTILVALTGTYVTEKILVPKLGKYKGDEIDEDVVIYQSDIRGLLFALIANLVMVLLFAYSIIPGLPGSGVLLDMTQKEYVNQLFGTNSYVTEGITLLFSFCFGVSGLFYSIGSGRRKENKDIVVESVGNISNIIVLMFFASLLISLYRRTNIGNIIVINLMNILDKVNFASLPLVLLFLLLCMISTIFVSSNSTKWLLISPIVVPIFMKANISPEFVQTVFRFGTSITYGLSPFMPYFVLFIAYMQKYSKETKKVFSINSCMKVMGIYSFAFLLTYLFIIVAWYVIKIPLGVGIYPTL